MSSLDAEFAKQLAAEEGDDSSDSGDDSEELAITKLVSAIGDQSLDDFVVSQTKKARHYLDAQAYDEAAELMSHTLGACVRKTVDDLRAGKPVPALEAVDGSLGSTSSSAGHSLEERAAAISTTLTCAPANLKYGESLIRLAQKNISVLGDICAKGLQTQDTSVKDEVTQLANVASDDFEQAFTVLELARLAYEKELRRLGRNHSADESTSAGTERRDRLRRLALELSDTLQLLAETSEEQSRWPEAITDYRKSLIILQKHLNPLDRSIAEAHYRLGTACHSQYLDAAAAARNPNPDPSNSQSSTSNDPPPLTPAARLAALRTALESFKCASQVLRAVVDNKLADPSQETAEDKRLAKELLELVESIDEKIIECNDQIEEEQKAQREPTVVNPRATQGTPASIPLSSPSSSPSSTNVLGVFGSAAKKQKT